MCISSLILRCLLLTTGHPVPPEAGKRTRGFGEASAQGSPLTAGGGDEHGLYTLAFHGSSLLCAPLIDSVHICSGQNTSGVGAHPGQVSPPAGQPLPRDLLSVLTSFPFPLPLEGSSGNTH